jgi:hypothetical protein
MKIRNFITVILSVSLISCGQSEQESDMSSEVVITENSQVQGRQFYRSFVQVKKLCLMLTR